MGVTSPHAKRRRIHYKAQDTPQIAVLVNPKTIKQHTMLVALEDKTIKRAQEKDKDEKVKAAAKAGAKAKAKA